MNDAEARLLGVLVDALRRLKPSRNAQEARQGEISPQAGPGAAEANAST